MTKRSLPSSSLKRKAERAGRFAELASSLFVMMTGWRILYRRRRTFFGEIDIVYRRGNIILCIEVKYRAKETDLTQILLSERQQKRLARAAQSIFADIQTSAKTPQNLELRFDVHIWTGRGKFKRHSYVALENTSWHFG